MAATKKPATASKAKTTQKKPTVARKTPAKKSKPKKSTPVKADSIRSFRLSRDTQKFISSRITLQTVYWAIFAIVILSLSLYILTLQVDILNSLEQIERNATTQ